MSQLISKLKGDHKKLVEVLEEVAKLGIAHPETPKKLTAAKAALLAHLKHEDVELYPVLRKAAETDANIKSTLNILAKDMESLAPKALAFFDKYEKGGSPMDFVKDFSQLRSALSTRIRREEETLYELFNKIADKKAA
ncbi:hemerythrin domain-containing protein [Peredibacter sp. HCB2-198]|uniref:hemerythrin domain-containing protein n=1 Tax=Peredibacter sp. HCB2-198 TaxID=3383025 RepID=UPI0038B50C17